MWPFKHIVSPLWDAENRNVTRAQAQPEYRERLVAWAAQVLCHEVFDLWQ